MVRFTVLENITSYSKLIFYRKHYIIFYVDFL